MITYKDCPNCGARRIHESVRLCEVCEVSEGYEKRLESMRAELDFERHERFRLDELRSELVFAFGFQVEELRRKLHECEKKRDEWQATAEKAIDASSEGTWMARAFDAERELAALERRGGHAVQELGWDEATKRGLARYHEPRKRADCLVMYPCDCTYPRDGQPDFNCTACHGLGAVAKTEMP